MPSILFVLLKIRVKSKRSKAIGICHVRASAAFDFSATRKSILKSISKAISRVDAIHKKGYEQLY